MDPLNINMASNGTHSSIQNGTNAPLSQADEVDDVSG